MTTRDAIVKEALEWVGTPYHHEARIKQVGVDCAQILIGVYSAVEAIPDFDTGAYPPDWHLHRSEEVFKAWVEDFADIVAEGEQLPGDMVLYKYGRCFAHGAIIIDWPVIVHAVHRDRAVVIGDGDQNDLEGRERIFYRLKTL